MKNPEIFVIMILYMCIVIGIGVFFYKKSQKNPENYKTLVVRVAGYSALFTSLSKSLQDDIIARTEQGF